MCYRCYCCRCSAAVITVGAAHTSASTTTAIVIIVAAGTVPVTADVTAAVGVPDGHSTGEDFGCYG